MLDYKINYYKLANLPQLKIYKFVLIIIFITLMFVVSACYVTVYHSFSTYGIYKNNTIHLKINSKLSDAVKKGEFIIFNNIKSKYQVESFLEYEIVNQDVYQNIYITVDNNYYDNEMGIVKFYYQNQKLIEFIFELFK